MSADGAPLLRVLKEGSAPEDAPVGTVVLGKPVWTDGNVLVIEGARDRHTTVYLPDLASLFGGDSELTLGAFLDAAEHGDQVRIAVEKDRISYTNAAQLARADTHGSKS